MDFLPYGRHCIEDDDVEAVARVLRSDYLTTGPAIAAFERELCRHTAATHAVACSSGTAALHLALLAIDFKPGDVAIVPSITFAATANAARYAGGEVVFADVDPDSGLMTAANFAAALDRARGRNLRAVLPVLLAGQGADAAEIAALAVREGITVIEDASHTIGAKYRDGAEEVPVGACRHSAMTIFSFHPVKTVAMGEGGAIMTRDSRLAARLERLRAHGIERDPAHFIRRKDAFDAAGAPNPWYYELQELGFNYRATDIHCALGMSQLAKLARNLRRRAELVALYDATIAKLAPRVRPIRRMPDFTPAWHLYAVLIDFAALARSRAEVMRALRARGIGSQVHYIPLHRQPYYVARYGEQGLPGAERYYARTLSLPLFPQLRDEHVHKVVAALEEAIRG